MKDEPSGRSGRSPEWYVVWVETGREESVVRRAASLEREMELLCPAQELWQRLRGMWQKRQRLFFPGYIFLHCGIDAAAYYAVKEMPGVLGWLGSEGGWPVPVPPEEMDVVLALAAGRDPAMLLREKKENLRQRRGYGTMTLHGQKHRVAYNIYREDDKQAEAPKGDTSPAESGSRS